MLLASRVGSSSLVQLLLEAKAPVDAKDQVSYGHTQPVHIGDLLPYISPTLLNHSERWSIMNRDSKKETHPKPF